MIRTSPILSALAGAAAIVTLAGCVNAAAPQSRYFAIHVVDAATGRGVPLVELRTVSEVRYYTDSNGIAAVGDPEMMGQSVYFKVKSPGYSYPKDGFGNAGIALNVTAGGSAVIKVTRDNIAERLYRLTGAGIYRDSVLVGAPNPLKKPLMAGLVTGQDTVEVTPYQGKLYWFFGDTNKPSYPLGQFDTSGATSLAPGRGGLDPSHGVDLSYWVGGDGFSRPTAPAAVTGGPVWVAGLFTLTAQGKEHLYTHYAEVDHNMKLVHSGLAVFNDAKAVFEPIHSYDLDNALKPEGHPFLASDAQTHYIYFQPPKRGAFPLTRTIADVAHVTDPATFEAFTCLPPGGRYTGKDTPLDRDASGKLIWAWKRNTQPVGLDEIDDLVKQGRMKADEELVTLRDIATDKPVMSHGGSVFWNAYRKRWILITTQVYGDPSFLGEVWFAEADTPVGPWTYARKIATHDHYTYYNPTQHPFFDQDGGRVIYFEGTYTDSFSDVKDITPRYNYNQLMYRLTLNDPRLSLPEPVYQVGDESAHDEEMREQVDANHAWPSVRAIPFYAVPPTRTHDGLVPIPSGSGGAGAKPLFYALPAKASASETVSSGVVSLYEYQDAASGLRWYSADPNGRDGRRSPEPICRAWRNPSSVLALDYGVTAVPARL